MELSPKVSQSYHSFRPTNNKYLLNFNQFNTAQMVQGGAQANTEVSHLGIFRCAKATSQYQREPAKSRFTTKRGWLSEVYATEASLPAAIIADPRTTAQVSASGHDAMPNPGVHYVQMPCRASQEENWRSRWSCTMSEEQQQFNTGTLPTVSVDSALEDQNREDQIKAVKAALLKSPSFLAEQPASTSVSTRGTTFSPPSRKKSLRRRSERTASLQRNKSSAFGEIRAADSEMCDLAQDLLTEIDDQVPVCKMRMGDRVHESIGELRSLEQDVDQLTRDLRTLKFLLKSSSPMPSYR